MPNTEQTRLVTRDAFSLMPDYLFQEYAHACKSTDTHKGCTIYLANFLPQVQGVTILIDTHKADPFRFQALQVNEKNSASLQVFVNGDITDQDKGSTMVPVAGCNVNAMQFGKSLVLVLDGLDKKKACQL